ncbi:Coiled-coil domain-containing protein 102B [Sciurus carolinensis]|uniref:Coiled-coil domain-containing protein 102B n=1 Tax=Sciurus carolinensis TaxID=30640 RepID=A0AA41MZE3_SCICA|nr:Coiled-coil domain-containing protein 102B [Sciurus carolinensis]
MAEAAVTEEAHCRLSCGTWASESSGQWDYGPISNQAEAATWRERGRERGAMERQVCPCVATGWHTEEPRGGLQGRQSPAAYEFRAPPFNTNKWDICEELRRRELEEVKARAAQMEKTMRWWSDCTANWREKWSKVRAERNSAREEGRQLRIKLEMTLKELSALKKKQSLSLQKEATEATVTQDLELPAPEELYRRGDQFQTSAPTCGSIRECVVNRQLAEEDSNGEEEGVVLDSLRLNEEMKPNSDCTDLFRNGGFGSCAVKPGLRLPAGNPPQENVVTQVSAWQLPLGDFQEILWKEREMRAALEKEIERLESALSLWKWKYEELRNSKVANEEESDILHGQHESEMGGRSGDIKEESTSQNSKDRTICELRAEVSYWVKGAILLNHT